MGKDKPRKQSHRTLSGTTLVANFFHPEYLLLNREPVNSLDQLAEFQGKTFTICQDNSEFDLHLEENDSQVISFKRKRISVESFNQKHIVFSINDNKEKEIIVEFTCDPESASSIRRRVEMMLT